MGGEDTPQKTRHRVAKACWNDPACRQQFVRQWEDGGEAFLYTEPVVGEPDMLWAVFEAAVP